MPAYSMQLAPVQRGASIRRTPDGRYVPDTTGPTSFCLNLRERVPGMLESVSRQQVLTTLGAEPFAVDVRDGRTNIFTISGTTLLLEGYLDREMKFHSLDTTIADLGERPRHGCAAGQFFIVALESGEYFYLLWNPDTNSYSTPGRLPAMPQLRVACSDVRHVMDEIPAVVFSEPVNDLRAGIPEKIAKQLGDAVTKVRDNALDSLDKGGYWTAPVLVRAAIRLWDGSLFHVTDPLIVSPEGGYQTGGRVLLNAVLDQQKGFTGTQASTMEFTGFRISASLTAPLPDEWGLVARSVEFWVSEQQDAVPRDVEPQVTANQSGSNYTIGVALAGYDASELIASLPARRMARAASVAFSETEFVELYRPAGSYSHPFVSAPRHSRFHGKTMLGHGAFLHLGNLSRELPLPSLPGGMTESATGQSVVSVEVNVAGKHTVIRRRTTATRPALQPLIWYPSALADKAVVTLVLADGTAYRREFTLHPVEGGEDAACWIDINEAELPRADSAAMPEECRACEEMPCGVVTMMAGNPFVASSLTRDCGGYVKELAAMPTGGGAYTRQFLYALCDTGIMALTHDRAGRHTNCRSISAEVLSSSSAMCTGSDSVWVCTLSHSLLRIRDARPETVLSGLPPVGNLAWNGRLGELWLVPQESGVGSLVIQTRCGGRAYLRTLEPHRFLNRSGDMLFLATSLEKSYNTFLCLPDALLAPEGSDLRLQLEYISDMAAPPRAGKVFAAVEMQGTTDADVELYAAHPGQLTTLTGNRRLMSVKVRGTLSTPLMVAVAMPDARLLNTPAYGCPVRPGLRLRLKGSFASFTGFSFVGTQS